MWYYLSDELIRDILQLKLLWATDQLQALGIELGSYPLKYVQNAYGLDKSDAHVSFIMFSSTESKGNQV